MSRNAKRALALWCTPVGTVLAGAGYCAALTADGHPALGLSMLAFSLVVGAAFVLAARRSETVRGLMDRRDERIAGIDLRATAAVGSLLILVILVSGMVEMARGHSGAPFTWLAVVVAAGYIGAVAVERARR